MKRAAAIASMRLPPGLARPSRRRCVQCLPSPAVRLPGAAVWPTGLSSEGDGRSSAKLAPRSQDEDVNARRNRRLTITSSGPHKDRSGPPRRPCGQCLKPRTYARPGDHIRAMPSLRKYLVYLASVEDRSFQLSIINSYSVSLDAACRRTIEAPRAPSVGVLPYGRVCSAVGQVVIREWKPPGGHLEDEVISALSRGRCATAAMTRSRPFRAFPCITISLQPNWTAARDLQNDRHRGLASDASMTR